MIVSAAPDFIYLFGAIRPVFFRIRDAPWRASRLSYTWARMTKVQLHYDLARPLDDSDSRAVADVHSHYGIVRVEIAPSGNRIEVDYDASRLTERDVENALVRFGLPIQRLA